MTAIAMAFRERRVNDIANFFAEDGVFVNARGPQLATDIFRGRLALRVFLTRLFQMSPDVRWDRVEEDWICGDRAVTQWRRRATAADGTRQDWLGCDLYLFEGRLIKRKDTFIKAIVL
ncbi:nuclear transport factor 2 family protein [Bradyrhizobium sp. USDA 4486]